MERILRISGAIDFGPHIGEGAPILSCLVCHHAVSQSADVVSDATVWIHPVLHEGYGAAIDRHGYIYRGIIPFVVLQITGLMLIRPLPAYKSYH
jgi:hypothetical protein